MYRKSDIIFTTVGIRELYIIKCLLKMSTEFILFPVRTNFTKVHLCLFDFFVIIYYFQFRPDHKVVWGQGVHSIVLGGSCLPLQELN